MLFVSVAETPSRGTWPGILFQILSISAYNGRKIFPHSSTRWISLIASSESLLEKRGSSRMFLLNFFDKAISGLMKTCVYGSLAIANCVGSWLFSLVKAMAFPVGIQLIIAFCSACRSFNGMRIMTTPGGSSMKETSWKIRLLPKPVLARRRKSLC